MLVPVPNTDENPLTCNKAYNLVFPPENAKQTTFGCNVPAYPTVYPLITTVQGIFRYASFPKPKPKSLGHADEDSYVEFTVLILKLIAPS